MKKRVCILGTGYVGLTLGAVVADKDFIVHCIEINEEIVKSLNEGEPHFHENGLKTLIRKNLKKTLFFSKTFPTHQCDIYVICVSTPIDIQKKPRLDYIISASEAVSKHMADSSLVIIRSTIPVGTSRNIIKPILEKSGKKFMLSFCPERTIEGKAIKELIELPQIIGGIDEASVIESVNFFKKITPTTIEVTTVEAAEMIKLINNSYRDLMFAYANEVALICEKLSINANEVINAANLGYPRSNIPVPGFVGGACLEKDPHILSYVSESNGFEPKIIKNARSLNEMLPDHVAQRIHKKITQIGKNNNAKIFVMGFAFKGKPETDDIRGSPTISLINSLKKLGYSNIFGFDPIVKPEVIRSLNVFPTNLEDGFKNSDCVIFANNHGFFSSIDIELMISKMNKPAVFFDCWHIFSPSIIIREGISYGGIGFE